MNDGDTKLENSSTTIVVGCNSFNYWTQLGPPNQTPRLLFSFYLLLNYMITSLCFNQTPRPLFSFSFWLDYITFFQLNDKIQYTNVYGMVAPLVTEHKLCMLDKLSKCKHSLEFLLYFTVLRLKNYYIINQLIKS